MVMAGELTSVILSYFEVKVGRKHVSQAVGQFLDVQLRWRHLTTPNIDQWLK